MKYEKTVNIVDTEISMNALNSNPMYDAHKERSIKSDSLTSDKMAQRISKLFTQKK